MAKEDEHRQLENLPESIVGFINSVIKKMRYRRKVRQDVHAELSAHFEDELKSCATEEEKRQKAQQLIADFGDPKLLAVLLRRAKKRCRPLWRTTVARTFQIVGVLIFCFAAYVFWFLSGKPVISIDYIAELNRIVRVVSDQSLNAAPLYDKAGDMIRDDTSPPGATNYRELTTEQKEIVARWITDHAEVFELATAGAQKPYYWHEYVTGPDVNEMMSVLVPNNFGIRRLAFALRWRAWLQAEQGQYDKAFEDMKSCYRLGQHLRGDKLLTEQLVGMAIEALATNALYNMLSEYHMDSATLARLQEDFERLISNEDFTISLKAERISTYDMIQRVFTGGLGGGHIIPSQLKRVFPEVQVISTGTSRGGSSAQTQPPGRIRGSINFVENSAYILFLHPGKQQTMRAARQIYDYWDQVKVKTPAQIRAEEIDIEKGAMDIVRGNMFLESLGPTLSRISMQAHLVRVKTEALVSIVALLRYQQEMGCYPNDIDGLIAANLPSDPYGAGLLNYKKTGDSFVLYSYGPNFTDDGGEIVYHENGQPNWKGTKDAGDMVFWPILKPLGRR
jgi:hypothetical protein